MSQVTQRGSLHPAGLRAGHGASPRRAGLGGPAQEACSLLPTLAGLRLSGWRGGALGLAIAELLTSSACKDIPLACRSLCGRPVAGASCVSKSVEGLVNRSDRSKSMLFLLSWLIHHSLWPLTSIPK